MGEESEREGEDAAAELETAAEQEGSALSRIGGFFRRIFGGLRDAVRNGMDMRTARIALRNGMDPYRKTPGEREAEARRDDERFGSRSSGNFSGRDAAREGAWEDAERSAKRSSESAREKNEAEEAGRLKEYSSLVPVGYSLKAADAEGFYTVTDGNGKEVLKINDRAFEKVMTIEGFATLPDENGNLRITGSFSKAQNRIMSAISAAEKVCLQHNGGYSSGWGKPEPVRLEGDMILRSGKTMLRYFGNDKVVKIPNDVWRIQWKAFDRKAGVSAIVLPEGFRNAERFADSFKKYHAETVIINSNTEFPSKGTITPDVLCEKIKEYCRETGSAGFRETDVAKILDIKGRLSDRDIETLTDACRKEMEAVEKTGRLARSGDEWKLTKEAEAKAPGEQSRTEGKGRETGKTTRRPEGGTASSEKRSSAERETKIPSNAAMKEAAEDSGRDAPGEEAFTSRAQGDPPDNGNPISGNDPAEQSSGREDDLDRLLDNLLNEEEPSP